MDLFSELKAVSKKPDLFSKYTTPELWNDPWISEQLLKLHLTTDVDMASRNHDFINKSAQWIIDRFDIKKDKKVCDFGCGPGLYMQLFARAGASVTGIDLSGNSLRYAKLQAEKEGLDVTCINENYIDYCSSETFDVAVMIFCDFCVLNPRQKLKFLSNLYDSLVPGGYFFFDVFSHQFFHEAKEENIWTPYPEGGFWSPDEYIELYSLHKYEEEKALVHRYTILERERRRESLNWLQCYDRSSIRELVESNGFVLKEVYSDVSGCSFKEITPEMALLLQKV